jgi:cell division protein ZapA
MSPPRIPPAKAPPGATLDVTILGREFKVACEESERAALSEAVAYLDGQMRTIRDGGKVTGVDRIAVMAALNIAHDLLRERKSAGTGAGSGATSAVDGDTVRRRIHAMQSAIEQTLAGQEKLF